MGTLGESSLVGDWEECYTAGQDMLKKKSEIVAPG